MRKLLTQPERDPKKSIADYLRQGQALLDKMLNEPESAEQNEECLRLAILYHSAFTTEEYDNCLAEIDADVVGEILGDITYNGMMIAMNTASCYSTIHKPASAYSFSKIAKDLLSVLEAHTEIEKDVANRVTDINLYMGRNLVLHHLSMARDSAMLVETGRLNGTSTEFAAKWANQRYYQALMLAWELDNPGSGELARPLERYEKPFLEQTFPKTKGTPIKLRHDRHMVARELCKGFKQPVKILEELMPPA